MRSTFHGLETSKRSLFTQQTAMNTAGHNIANANTPGFSRQVVNLSATNPIETPAMSHSTTPGQLGTGVETISITRVREGFLDDQFRDQNKGLGDWTVQRDTLESLEAIVNEPSDTGLRTVLDDFWNSWQDLSGQPDNMTARAVVMENTMALTTTLNDIDTKLNDLEDNLNESIDLKVYDMNTITSEIASLNAEIFRIENLSGDYANDLRDQRDLLTDELSNIINIDVTQTTRGYTIKTGNTVLVSEKVSNPLDPNSLPADITGGELHGYIASLDHVNTFQAQIDQLVKGLVHGDFDFTIPAGTILPEGTTLTHTDGTVFTYSGVDRTLTSDITVKMQGVNGLHQLGYTLEEPAQGGGLFFTTMDGSTDFTAGNIQLNEDIQNDVSKIAASTGTYIETTAAGSVEKVLKGNNQLSVWIAQMRQTTITFDQSGLTNAVEGEGTIDEAFRSMVGRLGVKSKEAIRQTDNHQVLVDQIDMKRQSVSGVSLDEEMANIVKFQHSYNASARMITAIDEMLDKVINGMGIVGR